MTDDTEYESTEPGRDVRIEQEKRPLYEELVEDTSSPFHDAPLRDVFIFSSSYGWEKTGRTPLSGDQHALFNRGSLSDQQVWLVKSIAVAEEETVNVLQDGKQVYKILQEYANAGIKGLHSEYVQPGNLFSDLSTELIGMTDVPNSEAD